MERILRLELRFSAWKAESLAIDVYPLNGGHGENRTHLR